MTWLILLKRYWWFPAGVALGIWLLIVSGQRDAARLGWERERAAHAQTVANIKTATATAKADDLANVVRVTDEQSTISKEEDYGYAMRTDALRREYAERLRRGEAPSDPGGSGKPGVPQLSDASCVVNDAPRQAELPSQDALIASEQAERLVALQEWARRQAAVTTTAAAKQ